MLPRENLDDLSSDSGAGVSLPLEGRGQGWGWEESHGLLIYSAAVATGTKSGESVEA